MYCRARIFEIMSQSLTTAPNVHPSPKSQVAPPALSSPAWWCWRCQTVIQLQKALSGSVLGSQKSKDERGPPHQGANGYHAAFLRLSTRYPEPSSPSTRPRAPWSPTGEAVKPRVQNSLQHLPAPFTAYRTLPDITGHYRTFRTGTLFPDMIGQHHRT